MTRQRRSRMHHGIRDISRGMRTRARTKDLDQIHEDIAQPEKLMNLEPDVDLPGLGQYYCLPCGKHFIADDPYQNHVRGKVHRRRMKNLKDGPYTQADAEAAVGLKTDNGIRSKDRLAENLVQMDTTPIAAVEVTSATVDMVVC